MTNALYEMVSFSIPDDQKRTEGRNRKQMVVIVLYSGNSLLNWITKYRDAEKLMRKKWSVAIQYDPPDRSRIPEKI